MTWDDFFLYPEALALLAALPVVWVVLGVWDRNRGRKLRALLGPRTEELIGSTVDSTKRRSRWFFVGALFFAVLSMLQPHWGERAENVEQRGVDLMVCLDVSRSMLARDSEPSRLERARREIKELASRLHGDRLGLVVFSGVASLLVPLTEDMESFADLVDLADTLSVDVGGTDLGSALDLAMKALGQPSGDHEAIFLITDGEDLGENGLRVARLCRERNVTVHCLGFGSSLGSKIPLKEGDQEVFLKDREGRDVVSVLESQSLTRIAAETGGEFLNAGALDQPLVALYEKRVRPMTRKEMIVKERQARQNRYQWPLIFAFVLWLADLFSKGVRR